METFPELVRRARMALIAALAVYGVRCMLRPDVYRLLDGVDLAIHETGHLVFAPFGEFVGFLGGTLLQLLLPAAFVLHFARRGDRFAASVALWWVAQNLWNVSVYVRDARARRLPLVGSGEHDWTYLLGRTGLLQHDHAIARAVHFAGVLVFCYAVARGFAAARGQESDVGRQVSGAQGSASGAEAS